MSDRDPWAIELERRARRVLPDDQPTSSASSEWSSAEWSGANEWSVWPSATGVAAAPESVPYEPVHYEPIPDTFAAPVGATTSERTEWYPAEAEPSEPAGAGPEAPLPVSYEPLTFPTPSPDAPEPEGAVAPPALVEPWSGEASSVTPAVTPSLAPPAEPTRTTTTYSSTWGQRWTTTTWSDLPEPAPAPPAQPSGSSALETTPARPLAPASGVPLEPGDGREAIGDALPDVRIRPLPEGARIEGAVVLVRWSTPDGESGWARRFAEHTDPYAAIGALRVHADLLEADAAESYRNGSSAS